MPGSPRVRLAIVGLGLALAAGLVAPRESAARGQAPASAEGPKVIYYKSRQFRIPVTIAPEGREVIREVRLWVSDDRGLGWKELGQTSPDRPEFPFRASRDGEYWFALQTVDLNGRIYPRDDRPVDPSLKVVVDTTPPTLILEAQRRRGSMASVRWEVRDEILATRSFALEYQVHGASENDWRSVNLRESDQQLVGSQSDFRLVGQRSWDAGTSDSIRVRASVKDRAGNLRVVERDLGSGLSAAPGAARVDPRDYDAPPPVGTISSRSRPFDESAPLDNPFETLEAASDPGPDPGVAPEAAPPPPRPAPAPGSDRTLLASSPRFTLQYAVEDAGPDGVAKVQLWVTHDGGRTWYPQPEDADRVSPYLVDVGGEGTFGLWLAVHGASGLGDPPPAPGDRPQMWVEVDSTPPVVQVDPPRAGTGNNVGRVLITWRASDPHLGPRPVTLAYRPEGSSAAWTPIAGPIENNGRYIWAVPPGVSARFRIKVEVEDTLGHRGVAETGPVLVDLARPKGRIIGLDAGPRPEARR